MVALARLMLGPGPDADDVVMTAFLSLLLPMAVRRVVDGFDARDTALLDQYFGAAIAVAALLAATIVPP